MKVVKKLRTFPGAAEYRYSWIGPPIDAHKKLIPEKTKWATYDKPETTYGKLSTRRIQIYCAYICVVRFWSLIFMWKQGSNKNMHGSIGFVSSNPQVQRSDLPRLTLKYYIIQQQLCTTDVEMYKANGNATTQSNLGTTRSRNSWTGYLVKSWTLPSMTSSFGRLPTKRLPTERKMVEMKIMELY